MRFFHYLMLASLLSFILIACSTFSSAPSISIKSLKFIGDVNIDSQTVFNKTILGGLSGVVYDKDSNRLITISDDRGERGTPRFYEFSVAITQNKLEITPVRVQKVLASNGKDFKVGTIDFEGITKLENGNLLLSSEGDERPKKRIMPALSEYTTDGKFVKDWQIPAPFIFEKSGKPTQGVRFNLAFESLSTTPDFKYTFTANENTLYQDGKLAAQDVNGLTRIIRYKNGEVDGIFPYSLSKIPNQSNFKKVEGDNGLVDMVAIDRNYLITMERAWVKNNYKNTIKLFRVSLSDAIDVKGLKSLNSSSVKTVQKELLLDLDTVIDKMDSRFQKLDNIEGITFGPTLPNGNKTLIVVSDNNFSRHQRTLFIAFEIIP